MMIQDNIFMEDNAGIFFRENTDTRIASFIYNSPKKRNRLKTFLVQKGNISPPPIDYSDFDIGSVKVENTSFPSQIDILHDNVFSPDPLNSDSTLTTTPMLVNCSTQHTIDVFLNNDTTFIPESPVYSNTSKNIASQNPSYSVNISTLLPQTAVAAEDQSIIGVQYPSGNANADCEAAPRRTFIVNNSSMAHDFSDQTMNNSVAHDSSNYHMKANENNSLSPVVPFDLLTLNSNTTSNYEEELNKNELPDQSKALANVDTKEDPVISANTNSVSDESSVGVELNHIVDTLTDSLVVTKRHNPKMKPMEKKTSKALTRKNFQQLDVQNDNSSSITVINESCVMLDKNTRRTFTLQEVKKTFEIRSQLITEINSQNDHLQNSKTSKSHIPKRKISFPVFMDKKMQSKLTDSVATNHLKERDVNQLELQSNVTEQNDVMTTRQNLRSRVKKSDHNTEAERNKSHSVVGSSKKHNSIDRKEIKEIKKQGDVEKVSNMVKNSRQKENKIGNKINKDSADFKKNSQAQDSKLQLKKSITDKACSLINAKEVHAPPTKNTSSFSGSQLVMDESDTHSSDDNISNDNYKEKLLPEKDSPIKKKGRKKVVELPLMQQKDSGDHVGAVNQKKSRATKNKNKQQTEALGDDGTEERLDLKPREQAMSGASNIEDDVSTKTAGQAKKKLTKKKTEEKSTVESSTRTVRNKKPDIIKDSNEPVLPDPKLQVKEETENGKNSKLKVKPIAEKKEPKVPVNPIPSRGRKKNLEKHPEEQELKVESEGFTEGKVVKTQSLPEQQEPKKPAGRTARPSRKKNEKLQTAEETVGIDPQPPENEDAVKPKATRKGRAKKENLSAEKQAPKQPVSAKPVRGTKSASKKEQGALSTGDVLGETGAEGKPQELKALMDDKNEEDFETIEKPLRKKKDTKKEPKKPVKTSHQQSKPDETNTEDLKGGKSQKSKVLPENQEKTKMVASRAKPSKNKKQDTKNISEEPVKSEIDSTKQGDTKQVDETKQNGKKTKSKPTPPVANSVQLTASKETGDGLKLKYVGVHCSITGGLSKAVFEAISYGAKSFGLFVRNGRNWTLNTIDEKEVDKFKKACSENNYVHNHILPHGSYLLNCGSSSPETLKKSRDTLIHELKICEKLGLTLYTFHPGSACHGNTVSECLKTIAESINLAHQETESVKTVIENMSGQGSTIGGKLEELKAIIDDVEDKSRIGVCLDTCHAFAAGYNIATRKGYEQFMKDFDDIIGLEYLCAVHLNDAKEGLGSNSDRHENIGKGHIGLEGFRHIMNDPRFNNLPMILETPKTNYAEEIKALYELESS